MSPSSQRIIRRLPPSRVADFDDQLWPVNCAILILAGFAAGLAIATGDFHADRLLYNAWFRLGVVALGMLALLAAVVFLQRKMVRRVQLCVVISLLVHLWLGMVLHQQYLAAVAAQHESQAAERPAEPEHVFRVPDYHWENLERPPSRHTFEEPVETEAPKPTDPEPIDQRSIVHEVLPERKPDVRPEQPRQQQPEPAQMRRAEPSAPRRATLAAGAQISRQPWRHLPLPDEPIPLPRTTPRRERQTDPPRSGASAPEHRQREVTVHQRRVFDQQPAATRERPVASLARRADPRPRPTPAPSTPSPMPKLSETAELAEAEIPIPKPTPRIESSPRALDAARGNLARRTSDAAVARAEPRPNVSVPAPVRRDELAMLEPIAPRRDRLPDLSDPSQPMARSVPRVVADALPDGTALVPPPARRPALAVGGPPSRIDATGEVAVTRSTAQAPAGDRIAAAGAIEPAIGSGPVPARVGQPRTSGRDRPALTASNAAPELARTDTSGVFLQAAPIPATVPAPQAPAAAHAGASPRQTAATEATAAVRGGSTAPPAARPNTGSGPAAARPGAPGPIGLAQSSRVTRHEAIATAFSGGGTPSPASRPAVVAAPEATFDMPQVAAAGPVAGQPGGTPMESAAGGELRRTAGLPGGRPNSPPAGAVASLERTGQRLPVAVAQRTAASQRDKGLSGTAPDSAVTIARADLGSRLPALDDVLLPSSAPDGTASSQGATADRGEPARLEAAATRGAQRVTPSAATIGGKGNAIAQLTAGAEQLGQPATTPGLYAGPRRLPAGDAPAQALAASVGGAPQARLDAPGLPHGLAGPIDVIPAGPVQVASAEEGEASEPTVVPAVGIEPAEPTGQSGGLPVLITAKPGPGGLSHEPSPVVGIPSRRARRESETVHAARRRFLLDRGGGTLPVDGGLVDLPAEAFLQRDPGRRARRVEIYGGTEGTERAVEMGLAFLVRCQFDDGHWSLDRLPEKIQQAEDPALGQMTSDTAATGLALLSFLGAGYTHESDKHRAVVRRGLDWLIAHQKDDGDLFTGGTGYAWFYSHGIATIALCEAYGMTRDAELREPARRAIGFIVASQHPRRGGWRYKPRFESDTSVAGWQLMALKSAQMADLEVPPATLEAVSRWLDTAQSRGGARYAYNPYAGDTPEQRHGRRPNLAMTAEGALMRMYLGWTRDHPALRDAADYLKANLPSPGTPDAPTRDVYYWYYATQVMFQMQGEHWETWNGRLQPVLQNSQQQSGPLAGSWHPTAPQRDRWGHAGGRLYVTTMNLLMLEVYYRHLPLFQTLE